MNKLPRVAGLILCKRMEVNPATVEMSLVGVFHALTYSAWPAYAEPFTVYAELFDASAEGTMELALMHLDTEEVIYSRKKWFVSSDRQLVFHSEIRVGKCVFPAPGRYSVVLRLDEHELTRRCLEVRAKEKAR